MARTSWLLCMLVTACGRVGFAELDASAQLDCTTLADGTACNDRNICTAVSKCDGGSCVAASPQASCTVADSEAEFSSTQGEFGWWYGTWVAEDDPTYDPTTDFEPAAWDGSVSVWESTVADTNGWAYHAAWGGHPDSAPLQITVRRWVSDVQGPATITFMVGKVDTTCGDGIEAGVYVDGEHTWKRMVAFDDQGGAAEIAVELALDTHVDFYLAPTPTDACDTTGYSFRVTSR